VPSVVDDPATVAGELIGTSVRVASWNLWWQFGNWEERLPIVIDRLRAADPDVIGLQEVWHDGTTTSAHVIGEALGFHVSFAGTIELDDGVKFGNAVVSRWPITAEEVVPLPAAGKPDEERVVLKVEIDGPRGPLQVYSTHLNWRLDHSAVRQEQVRTLAALIARSKPRTYPPIVCGDFNAEPHSAEIEMLTGQREVPVDDVLLVDVWRAARPTDPGFTWDNRNPYAASQLEWNRRIDYVFVGWPKAGGAGNPLSCALLGDEPTGDVWPSDHIGVLAELRY
jgi:endonuclease/exonuclease/phosphatase family metal-dependent hydrolase